MIFARFLAENSLLVEPESQVAVSLQDVEELAQDEKLDRWELAGQFAQRALPAIFRPDDPLLQVRLPREVRLQLDVLLDALPRETFLADDSLGWVYQFWQSAEKERVNKEGEKITGETLSAVTQLFTEHYMVLFLLHNTLGAWHAGKVLAARPELANSAKSEAELREALRMTQAGGYDFEYLRFVKVGQASSLSSASDDDDSQDGYPTSWRPMGGTFDGWPRRAAELKVLDPCCGSGHFLVAAFELLVRLRMLEEGLSVEAAVDAVIQDNLFGLELDPRCTQIAAFNVAVAAWKLTGPRPLPAMKNIACTGLSVGVPREQWMKALEADGTSNLRFYFGQLYDMFSNASTLGSLINPNRFLGSQMLKKEEMDRLFRALESVIASDPTTTPEQHELGVAAQGLARAAELLGARYHVVLTNVPYLGRNKQDDILSRHIEQQYELGKADLAAAFVLRCFEFCTRGGTAALVSPQNWLFLKTYWKLRQSLLENRQWNIVGRLGSGAFETIGGHVVSVALVVLTVEPTDVHHEMAGVDVSALKQPDDKATALRGTSTAEIVIRRQLDQLHNPDFVVDFNERADLPLLGKYAYCYQGASTVDIERFRFLFWEICHTAPSWELHQSSPDGTAEFTGMHFVSASHDRRDFIDLAERLKEVNRLGGWKSGRQILGRRGIAIAWLGSLPSSQYCGTPYDNSAAVIVPEKESDLAAIRSYVASDEYVQNVRAINQKAQVANATFVKVPFDLAHWQNVAAEKYPNGLPEPESDDPTQWLFHGHPNSSTSPIQVAIARLLGYRWPAELDPKMRLSERARQLVQSCEALLPFADADGIVCIPSVRGEDTAAARLTRLLESCNLKPPHKLDDWLRNEFFKEHCELFQQRPFIWHIWDGRKADGFHALVNYHQLAGPDGRKLLDNLTYSYLGDWINRQESDVKRGESGADGRLAAARTLQQQLVAILKGEPPYDIFVRWKPLHEQPIGWNPDINDGVRINIRPFMAVDIPGGRKESGILRWGPKIKWTKDRGKEPKRPRDEYPWFWGWDEQTPDFPGTDTFTGDRWSDCHYTNAFKQAAREKQEGK
jgi:hypothetical protein